VDGRDRAVRLCERPGSCPWLVAVWYVSMSEDSGRSVEKADEDEVGQGGSIWSDDLLWTRPESEVLARGGFAVNMAN
jgi:hypothetical protein